MALGCCGKTFSCLFIFFNVIFSIIGIVTLGFGILIKVHPSPAESLTQIDEDGCVQYLDKSAWIIIVFGALVLLVSFCGCVGAYNKSECMLGMYITFSLIILFGVLAICISTIVFFVRDLEIDDKSLKKIMETSYKLNSTNFIESWDLFQRKYECCGLSGPDDYDAVFAGKDKGKVPPSCCKTSATNTEAASSVSCPTEMYTEGCFKSIQVILVDYGILVLVAEFFIIALAIIGIIIAACLCRRGDEKDEYSTL